MSAQQLAVVAEQLPGWIPRRFPTAEALISLAVHLVLGPSTRCMAREMQLGCERGAITVLQLLLRSADPAAGHGEHVRRTAEHLLGERGVRRGAGEGWAGVRLGAGGWRGV